MNIFKLTSEYIQKGTPVVVVSAVEKQGKGPVEVGKKMLVLNTEESFGTVGGGALELTAQKHCKEIFKTKRSESKTYLLNEGNVLKDATTLPMACGGNVTLFYEYIGPSEYIYIFGGGHCGQALSNILSTLNYHVTIIDERKDIVDNFQGGDEVILSPFTEYLDNYNIEKNSYIVVATPSHKYDYQVINKVIEKQIKVKYFGMLCSTRKLEEYLKTVYQTFGEDVDLTNFYSPIGLDTGGGSPEEIAISIAAEILAVSNNKKGHLHMRKPRK